MMPKLIALALAADHRVHALHRHVEHFARRHRVNVDAVVEGLAQARDVGDVGEQAQFDLRVVGREQDIARRGDEGLADLAAFLGADRNVLQVRVGGGEAAGLRAGKRVGRVDAAGVRVDRLAQRLRVGRAQLGQHAPVEQDFRQLVAVGGEVFQRVRAGGPRAGLGASWRRRRRRGFISSNRISPICFGLPRLNGRPASFCASSSSARHALREFARELREPVAIDEDACALHLGDDGDQRTVHAFRRRSQRLRATGAA